MKVIHICRKPLSGSTVAATVLEHGTGALNIDACRVDYGGLSLEQVKKQAGSPTKGTDGDSQFWQKGEPEVQFHPEGRWPANVILEHLLKCGGTAEDCAPGCPVAELDAQSGTTRSPSTYTRTVSSTNIGTSYSQGIGEPAGKPSLNYGDTGGASRFFKQIGGNKTEK